VTAARIARIAASSRSAWVRSSGCWSPETTPPEARAACAGVATAVNWFKSFLVGLTFATLVDAIGVGPALWIFAGVCALGYLFVHRYVPETKDRTFHEIDPKLSARISHSRQRAALG